MFNTSGSSAEAVDVSDNIASMGRQAAHGLLRHTLQVEHDQHAVVVVCSRRVRRYVESAAEVAETFLVAH